MSTHPALPECFLHDVCVSPPAKMESELILHFHKKDRSTGLKVIQVKYSPPRQAALKNQHKTHKTLHPRVPPVLVRLHNGEDVPLPSRHHLSFCAAMLSRGSAQTSPNRTQVDTSCMSIT